MPPRFGQFLYYLGTSLAYVSIYLVIFHLASGNYDIMTDSFQAYILQVMILHFLKDFYE